MQLIPFGCLVLCAVLAAISALDGRSPFGGAVQWTPSRLVSSARSLAS